MQLSAIYKRVTSLLSAAALASVILAGGLTTPVSGQFGRIGSGGPPGESRFSSDPPLVRQFQRASSLLQQGNVTEAIPLLQALLDHPADTYLEPEVASHDASDKPDEVPDQPSSQKSNRAEEVDAGAPRSLKQTVVNTLRSLPQDGRTHYEQEYGPVASGLVQRYRESSEPAFLREAIRRFALTDAGAQAGRMLAAYEMDHGHALASARLLQQVRENGPRPPSPEYLMMEALAWERAGMTGQSAKFVSLLREVSPADGFTLAGRRIVVPAAENAEQDRDWLQKLFGPPPDNTPQPVPEWLFSGGDPTRNAAGLPAAAVGTPLWQIPLFDEVDFANHDQYQLAVSTFAEQLELRETTGAMRIPATSPLVVDDLVVLRTLSRVQAFDLRTGQLRWKSAIEDDAYRRLLAQEGKVMPGMTNQQLPLADLIAQRAWDDATYGRLSSDGKYVFVLEDVGFLGPFRNYRNAPPNRFTPRGFNRLVAYEVRTGRIAWEVGDTREGAPLRLAGNFFLGSPLPYDGRLYCLAESSGEILLHVLDPATGQSEWTQPLLRPEFNILELPARRQVGLTPAISQGVIVCPTMAGAIVAVDLTLQRLLWQFQYRDLMQVDAPHRGPALAELSSRYNLDDEHVDHWQETSVTITGGQIVFGARDSSEVFCLDLASGRPNWSLPRDQALSVATADSERVVLLGRNQLQAYRLDNAEPIWESPIPIPEPGGQGLRNGDRYRLPLSTGDFVTVNLVSGRIEARSPLESAAAAGNLVTGKGVLVAQSATQLTAFTPLDQRANEIEAHLAQTPDDPHWLALRGELRLHSGQRAEGLIDLRKSLQQRVDPRIRRLIVSTLLEAMRLDFDGQDTATAEIEKLVTEPAQRAVFLRLYAEGLHRAGRVMEAYDRYVEMADLASEQSKLERIDSKLSVRMDCWVRSRLTDLYQTASPADQKTLRDRISHRIAEAAEQPGTASLQSLLNSLGGPPFGSEIRQQIVAKMEPTTTPLELELELLALRESSGQTTRGEATARLTLLYLQQNMPELAFWLLDELEFDFPDVVCLDGKTGRDLVDLWKDRPELAGKDESISPWPTGEIQARRIRRSGSLDRLYPIEIRGRYGTPTFDWQLQIDQSREFLYARDASQRLLWKFALKETGVPVPYIDGHAAYSCGHLLVVSMGNQFVVLDTMSTPGEPKLLWKLSYYEITADPLITGIQLRPVIGPGGKRRSVVTDVSGQPLGEVAAVTSNCLYYQVGTHLYAADVLTGKILWERRGVQPGLEIFGDDQYLFVVSPEGEHVRLIRSSDGEDLGTRPIPPAYYRLHTSGRRTVLLNRDRAIPLLASVDLVTSGVVWKEEFQEPALVSIIGDDEIGILRKSGQFTIQSLTDGSVVLEANVRFLSDLEEIIVLRSQRQYVLLTTTGMKQEEGTRNTSSIGLHSHVINGDVFAFDRLTGELLWNRNVSDEAIDLQQPVDLPVLIFSSRITETIANRRTANRTGILILDARNGKTVYEEDWEEPPSVFEVRTTRDYHRIILEFYRSMVMLEIEDAQPEGEKQPGS